MKDGDMRLADGGSSNEGRVEIYYSGQWGTVCENMWDLTDASVVCRALGFRNATEALGGAAFGPGNPRVPQSRTCCQGTRPRKGSYPRRANGIPTTGKGFQGVGALRWPRAGSPACTHTCLATVPSSPETPLRTLPS